MTTILSTPPRLSREQAVVLARYAGGDSAKTIADDTGTDLAVVGRILDEHAGNNRDRARQLVTAYGEHAQAVAAAHGTTTPANIIPGPRRVDGIAALLEAADATGDPRVKKTVDKIRELLAGLRADMATHQADARLRQEQAALEARLAEIKKQLRPAGRRTPAVSAPAGEPAGRVDNKAIRQWAAERGIACSATGRIPASVVDAYHQAVTR